MPGLSVIIPSFNHARFIERSIRSVLSQSYDQIEVIVIDDASNDESVRIIEGINDDRLKKVYLEKNRGGAAVLNLGIELSSGEYIAICNSDDEWMPDKLSRQLPIISSGSSIGAVFTDVQWVDDRDRVLSRLDLPYHDVFRQPNRSNFKWLKDLIEFENCLCHPSILIRRSVYESTGLYDNRFRQFPDYDMWLRVVEKHDIFIMPEQTVKFRILRDKQNASSDKPSNTIRAINEWELIFSNTFNRLSADTFVRSFGSIKPPDDSNFCLPLEKALYLLNFKTPHLKSFCAAIARKILFEVAAADSIETILASYALPDNLFQTAQGLTSPWIDRTKLGALTEDEQQLVRYIAGVRSTDPVGDLIIRDLPIEKFRSIEQIRNLMVSPMVLAYARERAMNRSFARSRNRVERLRDAFSKVGEILQNVKRSKMYPS